MQKVRMERGLGTHTLGGVRASKRHHQKVQHTHAHTNSSYPASSSSSSYPIQSSPPMMKHKGGRGRGEYIRSFESNKKKREKKACNCFRKRRDLHASCLRPPTTKNRNFENREPILGRNRCRGGERRRDEQEIGGKSQQTVFDFREETMNVSIL